MFGKEYFWGITAYLEELVTLSHLQKYTHIHTHVINLQ